MEAPDDTARPVPASRPQSAVRRFAEIVLIWGLIVGFIAALSYGISGVLRDSLRVADRLRAEMRAAAVAVPSRADAVDSRAVVGDTPAGPHVDNGKTITASSWSALPQPEYPDAAFARAQEGSVSLSCQVKPTGELGACTIVEESHQGLGFGAAALASTQRARLALRTVDGLAQYGEVRFTVSFKMAPPNRGRIAFPWERKAD